MSKQTQIVVNVPIRPLPIVSFSYPSSKSPKKLVARHVKVIDFDGHTLRGFEVNLNNENEPGKFKAFHSHRIQGAIHFIRQDPIDTTPEVKIKTDEVFLKNEKKTRGLDKAF